jgi:hypothetical protein
MQRMWIRTLICVAVVAGTVVIASDAQARHRRGGCGSSGGYYSGGYYGGKGGYTSGGYTYGGYGNGYYRSGAAAATYDANGRYIGPAVMDRSARTGAGVDARLNGQISPSDRTRAGVDANIDARGNVPGANVRGGADVRGGANVPGTDVQGGANLRGGADINRNDGAIRGNADADANLRGNVTPPEAPRVPAVPDSSTLPPPVPTP